MNDQLSLKVGNSNIVSGGRRSRCAKSKDGSYLLNRPKVDGDNLYAVPVASSTSAFLDACEEPPWYAGERLVTQYEREKPRWGNNYHGPTIWLRSRYLILSKTLEAAAVGAQRRKMV